MSARIGTERTLRTSHEKVNMEDSFMNQMVETTWSGKPLVTCTFVVLVLDGDSQRATDGYVNCASTTVTAWRPSRYPRRGSYHHRGLPRGTDD